jgi:glycerol-3-phosphate dehydrogenase
MVGRPGAGALPGSWRRSEHRRRLVADGPFDVLVIGGGITGAGAALDLATRGLHVALVEQRDLAAGTSSRSTKLLHGGVRYLPSLHLRLVAEGLHEQKVLARTADHLFEPLEFVVPLLRQHGFASAPRWLASGRRAAGALRVGLTAYDLLGGRRRPGRRHRRLSAAAVAEAFPRLRTDGLTGGFAYSDARTQDARLVVSVARTAVLAGAVVVNRVRVDALQPVGDGWRVDVTDALTGEAVTVVARAVLAATGASTPPAAEPPAPPAPAAAAAGPPGPGRARGWRPLDLVLSQGSHVLVAAGSVGLGDRALVLPETEDRRVLYLVPWLGHALIGTTDLPYHGDPTRPRASDEEVEYLFRHVARYLDVGPLEPTSTFAGVRALAADTAASGTGATGAASREHVVRELAPGYVAVAGGKLTTYRRIAAEAADHVVRHLGVRASAVTAEVPLAGSWTGAAPGARAAAAAALADAGVPDDAVAALLGRYGADAAGVAALCREHPEWAGPSGVGVVAEAAHAVRAEGAADLDDVTLRRTPLALTTPDHARSSAPALAAVMGAELGWTPAERDAALARHEAALQAEGL